MFLYAMTAAVFLTLALSLSAMLILGLIQRTVNVTIVIAAETIVMGSFVFSRYFILQAENLKHPLAPKDPVIDKV